MSNLEKISKFITDMLGEDVLTPDFIEGLAGIEFDVIENPLSGDTPEEDEGVEEAVAPVDPAGVTTAEEGGDAPEPLVDMTITSEDMETAIAAAVSANDEAWNGRYRKMWIDDGYPAGEGSGVKLSHPDSVSAISEDFKSVTLNDVFSNKVD